MRTIRTKVYQFSELSEQAKETAIRHEAAKFRLAFCIRRFDNLDENELQAAKDRLIKYEYEFKADGTRY